VAAGRGTAMAAAGSDGADPAIAGGSEASRLRLKVIERVAILRFANADFLVGETTVREVISQLEELVEVEGHLRLLLNFASVRYLSSEMLAALVGFQRKLDRRGGRVQLCDLDPLLRELFRSSRLESAFDICTDEAEALGLLIL
jgi:anti-anti-sigma factor